MLFGRTLDGGVRVCLKNRILCFVLAGISAVLPLKAAETAPATKRSIAEAFESTTLRFEASPGTTARTIAWEYTNHWDFPLFVERIDSACGCLAAQKVTSDPIPSGKSGKITATFTAGNHRGLLRKSIHVRFAGHDQSIELVAEARIPSTVELSTNELIWAPNQLSEARTLEVTSGTNQKFSITGLLGIAESQFTIRQETIGDHHYRLHITPVGQPSSEVQILQIRTDSPDPRDQVLAVFLQVRSPDTSTQTAVAP